MEKFPEFVDMAITPDERAEYGAPIGEITADLPKYPYGLSISLCDSEIEKLDLEDDCEVGDALRMDCLVKITSVTRNDTESGTKTRIELQIVGIAVDSDTEDDEAASPKMDYKKFYKK